MRSFVVAFTRKPRTAGWHGPIARLAPHVIVGKLINLVVLPLPNRDLEHAMGFPTVVFQPDSFSQGLAQGED